MNKGILTKILATMLVVTMTFANIALLGAQSYALNANLENQDTKTNNASVNFDAYFKDEGGAKTHTVTNDINAQTMLYLYISVDEGYLKEANIEIGNPNFELVSEEVKYDEIANINASTNIITLNKIRKGEKVELAIPVKAKKAEIISHDMFSKETSIAISGVLVKDNSKTTKIEKAIKIKANWKGSAEIELSQGVTKYVLVDEDKSVVLQTKIKTSLIDNNLPVEKTNIQTVIPKINGISPNKIYVNSKEWTKDDKTVTIESANPIENNKIVWKKDNIEENIITYIYGEEAYESVLVAGAQLELKTDATITAYNLETTKLTKQDKKEGTLEEKVNDIVMFNVETGNAINKGYMYAQKETKYNENITIDIAKEELKIQTATKSNTYKTKENEITANTEYRTTKINKDNFKTILGENGYINIYNQNNQKIAVINKETPTDKNNNYIINYDIKTTSIKIETSETKTVGKLKIENEKVITSNTSNEETKKYEELKTNIISNVKYNEQEIIKEKEIETISKFIEPTTQIKTVINNNTLSTIVENTNVEIRTILKSSDITCKLFKNPKITIKLPDYIENVSFNEAVKILFTDELQIETGTYNPETKVLEITLKGEQTIYNDVSVAEGPTIVLNANIKLNQLTPSKQDEIISTIVNDGETVEARALINYVAPVGMVTVNTISGYNGEETASSVSGQETTGKIETNTASKTAVVQLTIINNNNNICKNISILGRTPFEGNKSIVTNEDLGSTFTADLTSRISAVEGIDNSKIAVYYSANPKATKDLNDQANGWTQEPENLAEMKSYLIVLQDYEMEIGTKLSFKYNAQIPEGLRNDEKTFGTFVVYYDNVIKESIKPEENTTQNNEAEQQTPTTNENTVPNENTTGNQNTVTNENTTGNQNTVPNENTTGSQNTVANENTTGTQNTVTNENTTTQEKPTNTTKPVQNQMTTEVLIPEQTQATVVGVSTKELPSLEVNVTSDVDNELIVKEGQVINYTITVVNLGEEAIENAMVIFDIPEGTTYRELIPADSYSHEKYKTNQEILGKQLNIEKLEKNSSTQFQVQVIVNQNINNLESISAKARVQIEGMNDIESQENKKFIMDGALNIDVVTRKANDKEYSEGEEIEYIAKVQNIRNTSISQIIVTSVLPEEVDYLKIGYIENADIIAEYNEETRTAKWKISNISANSEVTLMLTGTVKNGAKEILSRFVGSCYEFSDEVISNNVKRKVSMPNLEVKHTTNVSETYVDVGDILEYYIEVKNTGTAPANNVKIVDYLPAGVEEVKLSYIKDERESEEYVCENREATLSGITIEAGKTLLVKVKAKISQLAENAKGTIELKNYATVNAEEVTEIRTNEIIHKIKVKEQPKEDEEKKISISGIAWLDSSRDGIRDDNEELLKNIEVTLITKEEAKVVKTTKTNKKGEYTFEDVPKGEYLVVFKFDTTKYVITKYQVEGGNEGKNSDAALQQVTTLSDGRTIDGAITNTIKVEDANIYNIDIGLQESLKFDLSLTKTITKVSKQDDNGIKTYDYSKNGKTLAKVEIPSNQVNKTTIIVEYTLTVKNEGNVAGYAKNIVDYLPSNLNFASELNKNWYKSTDGNLYNKSLADTIINPGESKEIKLLVTKVTNENNLGTINNSAEIAESYNDYGVADIDSTAGNKQTKEDDYGTADILISLNTGTVVMYTSLIISMVALIGIGAYMINKKVLGEF